MVSALGFEEDEEVEEKELDCMQLNFFCQRGTFGAGAGRWLARSSSGTSLPFGEASSTMLSLSLTSRSTGCE